MNNFSFLKIFLLFIAIAGFALSSASLHAQHLFSVSYNHLSSEKILLVRQQIVDADISSLSMIRNTDNRDVFPVSLSSVQNTQIIILNEETGSHVVINPAEEMQSVASLQRTEFQLAPFFIKELKQGALGNANRYLVMETSSDFSVKSVSSVSTSDAEVYIPRYFYGGKENVKEALPRDRQILHIFKQNPQLIIANPEDPELQRFAAQWEEERSYYIYMYQLPDGTLCTYDEHFNPDNSNNVINVGGELPFALTAINMDATKIAATEYALGIWSATLAGTVAVDISVEFKNLGGGNVIGQSFRMQNFNNNNNQAPNSPANTWYPSSLWNQLIGYDVTSGRDIKIEMNTNFNFYFGTTGNPSYYQLDWITVMLHEVTHGLGFYPLCGQDGRFFAVTSPSGNNGIYTNDPGIFDLQLFQGTNGSCITELTQSQRQALFVSNNLYAGAPGSNLLAANNNVRVKMYAPSSWQGGSSTSHWDNSVIFTTFMKYALNQGWKLHTIGPRKLGILMDMGWEQPGMNPDALYVTFNANGGTGNMGNQMFLPDIAQPLRTNIFTREGYVFANWNTEQDGSGTDYEDKQSITISEDMVLYAQWQPNTYTLTFNPGSEGTVNPTSKQVTFGLPVGELPIPERPGFVFNYWRYGGTIFNEETIWNNTTSLTVQASWAQGTYYTISATASAGGEISPSGNIAILSGKNQKFIITPNEDYEISDVVVDAVSIGVETEYSFDNVNASHTIHAEFKVINKITENDRNRSIQIIPNPAKHFVEIRIMNDELGIGNIEFYNIFGQVVKLVHAEGKESQKIDISDLHSGIYFVKVGEKTVKLVVN